MDRTHDFNLDKCCEEYYALFADFLKTMTITKATPTDHPLFITERNQSVYFFNAVKSVYTDATAWFEFPFNTNEHLDALILIPKNSELNHKQVLLVESKNIRTLNNKIPGMIEDVRRIDLGETPESEALKSKLKALFGDLSEISFFGVILCDVQKTSDDHMELANKWENKEKIEEYICSKLEQKAREGAKTWIKRSTAKKLTQTIFYKGNKEKPIHYDQLIRYWPIKNINE